MRRLTGLLLCLVACEPIAPPEKPKVPPESAKVESAKVVRPPDAEAPGKEEIVAKIPAAVAPPASPRSPEVPALATLRKKTDSYFEGRVGRRIHIQVDKPVYQPGETIWFRAWDLKARDLSVGGATLKLELVSPKGSVVLAKLVALDKGVTTNDFEIPEEVQGGEYKLRVSPQDGATAVERPVIISTYEPPQMKKKLEFVRKAYGPGDEVSATISVKRNTGEPLANHPLRGVAMLDGEALTPVSVTTNAEGGAVVSFPLPKRIERGDGLLTVMVEFGGITESISKSIPIVLRKVQLSFFPEGGQMVAGAASRLYFEAKNSLGKPADVEGQIVDDQGNAVAEFRTHHFGLGRMSFTPSTGRSYHARVSQPTGITEEYPVPIVAADGCVLGSFDDFDGELPELRVSVRCTKAQKVIVAAMLREKFLDVATIDANAGEPAIVYLAAGAAQGVARVTVFDESLNPLAERLVFRNRRGGLQLEVTPDKTTYSPRDKVTLRLTAKDAAGQPVEADLALSVVDDTVVSYADDKTGNLLAKIFLEPEIADSVEEPNFFFDLKEKKGAEALDNLMGTRGYRRFEWKTAFNPPPPAPPPRPRPRPRKVPMAEQEIMGALAGVGGAEIDGMAGGGGDNGVLRGAGGGVGMGVGHIGGQGGVGLRGGLGDIGTVGAGAGRPRPAAPAKPMDRAPAEARRRVAQAPANQPMERKKDAAPAREIIERQAEKMAREPDADWNANQANRAPAAKRLPPHRPPPPVLSAVRVFPAPAYNGPPSGPRTDFRETVHWAPALKTDVLGRVESSFYLSDAVTSFRVFVEAVGQGRAGRTEKVVKSSLPFSVAAKLPVEVSAGDRVILPLTLSNERQEPIDVQLTETFGDLVQLETSEKRSPSLLPGTRQSLFYPLKVVGKRGKTKIRFVADAGGLKDELERELEVVPVGFPITHSVGGTLEKTETLSVDIGEAVEGSVVATLKLEPGPVGTLLNGLQGMLQEPSGCFEQTSSTNYPNVMIMQYLRSNRVADPEFVERVGGLLDRGYKKLVGFEADKKGYEWFGRAPAHEALTAYGLLEFVDMKPIYGDVDPDMMARTEKWLLSRRDGRGGFSRDGKALDTFGSADPEITDAYIVYALTEAKFTGIGAEIEVQATHAALATDPYLLALATNTLLNSKRPEAAAAVARLISMQQADGSWRGQKHSITRSTGANLHVETTALALLALMKAKAKLGVVSAGVRWLYGQRGVYGAFGATQSTVLALKALTNYHAYSKRTQTAGAVLVKVNGQDAGRVDFAAGRREPIVFEDLGRHFQNGKNTVELTLTAGSLPFNLGVEHRSTTPATHPDTVVALETRIAKTALLMGESVRVTATLKNKTDKGQPMTLVRVGIPGGLQFQNWQLKELREKGTIAFYETRAREVILYFRELAPNEAKEIPIDLVAEVPGEYVGPASSAYLYYTNDQKHWTEGLRVQIKPPG